MKPTQLIHRYLSGEATESEVTELDQLLAEDPALRKQMIFEAGLDTSLRELALERISNPEVQNPKVISPVFRPIAWIATAAAIALMTTLIFSHFSKPEVIATLVSGENASWESALPTTPGSDLTAGTLNLTSGIATIRFKSGAEVMLEAPAQLVLETSMRGKLLAGSAIIEVPEPAIGFIIETPDGYAVDHGTQFAVSVNKETQRSDFEVLEGEISVHLPNNDKEVRLGDQESASISKSTLRSFDGPLPERELAPRPRVTKVKTEGRATTILKDNNRSKLLNPELLMVRKTGNNLQTRRSLISFDISKVDFSNVKAVRLGMKMIPTGIGFASRLPVKNTFAIYGVTDPAQENWPLECLWQNAPKLEEAQLLDTIEVGRSRQDKYCVFTGKTLLDFLKADPDGIVSLIITRETGQIDGTGPGLVHAFATDAHPEASGPVLRFYHRD